MRYSSDMEDFRTGYGRDWLDFAITLVDRYGDTPRDLVRTPTRLRSWLTEWELAPGGPVTDDDVTRARELREALHGLARAAASEQAPAAGDVRVVNTSLLEALPVELRRSGTSMTVGRPATARQALARLARQAADDLTGPNRPRLRACGDDECSGIFLDPTGRRRWCSDERCGVKARVRAHRARKRDSGAGAS
jgi:predicted RNA-binding Zn ribbon-like protein